MGIKDASSQRCVLFFSFFRPFRFLMLGLKVELTLSLLAFLSLKITHCPFTKALQGHVHSQAGMLE